MLHTVYYRLFVNLVKLYKLHTCGLYRSGYRHFVREHFVPGHFAQTILTFENALLVHYFLLNPSLSRRGVPDNIIVILTGLRIKFLKCMYSLINI